MLALKAVPPSAQTRRLPRNAWVRLDPQSGQAKTRCYRLVVEEGPDAGSSVAVEGTLRVGTLEGAGLRLSDPTVSRTHFEVAVEDEGLVLRDLGSSNGTFVGGVKVREVVLGGGTRVVAGTSLFRVEVEESAFEADTRSTSFFGLLGASAPMRQLFGLLERVASSDATVLLTGEPGAGKEQAARALHAASERRAGPFVVVDCAALSPELVDSELFGHLAGAFTGAARERVGLLAQAAGGTVFLDEVGELRPESQTRLLRALEARTIRPLGSSEEVALDARFIASSRRELDRESRTGTFRRDLYFRLAVILAQVPPLRARREDLPVLVEHFARQLGRPDFVLPQERLAELAEHPWPGNVRELRNAVERALAGEPFIPRGAGPSLDPAALQSLPFKDAKDQLVEQFTREYVEQLLAKHQGNVAAAAKASGLSRPYLHHLLTKLGLRDDV